ncbi:unnamed protein product [Caenorhabditis auriculariae]|uniref:Uncharacterized protein n=1 Tax=Caenorhabditis auriculariae TaxID=2777116 RepID=A0A8S1H7F4_9PELO|nr:unnamed protein product [Caenorhabditis auriculariae]
MEAIRRKKEWKQQKQPIFRMSHGEIMDGATQYLKTKDDNRAPTYITQNAKIGTACKLPVILTNVLLHRVVRARRVFIHSFFLSSFGSRRLVECTLPPRVLTEHCSSANTPTTTISYRIGKQCNTAVATFFAPPRQAITAQIINTSGKQTSFGYSDPTLLWRIGQYQQSCWKKDFAEWTYDVSALGGPLRECVGEWRPWIIAVKGSAGHVLSFQVLFITLESLLNRKPQREVIIALDGAKNSAVESKDIQKWRDEKDGLRTGPDGLAHHIITQLRLGHRCQHAFYRSYLTNPRIAQHEMWIGSTGKKLSTKEKEKLRRMEKDCYKKKNEARARPVEQIGFELLCPSQVISSKNVQRKKQRLGTGRIRGGAAGSAYDSPRVNRRDNGRPWKEEDEENEAARPILNTAASVISEEGRRRRLIRTTSIITRHGCSSNHLLPHRPPTFLLHSYPSSEQSDSSSTIK